MKKIKKLNELSFFSELSEDRSLRIKGGACTLENCGSGLFVTRGGGVTPKPYEPTLNPNPGCGCGCAGCAPDNGGPGFTIGMIHSGLTGRDCSYHGIF